MEFSSNTKVIRVLKKLLEPNFNVKNDVYLNSLLKHLRCNPEHGVCSNQDSVNTEFLPHWILEAVTTWENFGKPSSQILSFSLNLVASICINEQSFVFLNGLNTYERIINILCPCEPNTPPTVQLGFIKLISALLEHKSGLQWILSTNYWADVMCLTLKNRTVFITKEGYQFLAKLLDRSVTLNKTFCANIVQIIMTPFSQSPCIANQKFGSNPLEVMDETVYQSLSSNLSMTTEILQFYLEHHDAGKLKVVQLFLDVHMLDEKIKNLMLIAQSEDFIYHLAKLRFLIIFLKSSIKYRDFKDDYLDLMLAEQDSEALYEILTNLIVKGRGLTVIKLSYMCFGYWKYISDEMPVCKKSGNETMYFEYQLLLLQLMPILSVSLKLIGTYNEKLVDEDEWRSQFLHKMSKNVAPGAMRVVYKWRDAFQNGSNLIDHASLALNYVLKSIKFITRPMGTMVFQCLIYSMSDIILTLKEHPDRIVSWAKEYNYLSLLLEVTAFYIKEFNLTWRDGMETICVCNVAFDFLSFPAWPSKLIVKCLQLIDIAILHYMTPNMALLIDSVNGSTMAFMGPMILGKLHDSAWEVRDSALEVLCSILNKSKEEFPSFRKMIQEMELPTLVLKMATKDGEPFVRRTAIKCLRKIAQVPEFWCSLTKDITVMDEILQILKTETEGTVRAEAASLFCAIYEHQKISPLILSQLYDIMTHASTADLHWEVKVNALNFWDLVIKNHLTHQGMIDGTFPQVTFSMEHRKIVNLNEGEVRKRLIKVLNQLSETGCLFVLVAALQDDCDIEVSKAATKITKNFVDLLKTYSVNSTNANLNPPPSPLALFTSAPVFNAPPAHGTNLDSGDLLQPSLSPGHLLKDCKVKQNINMDLADSILENILNSRDSNLLQGVLNQTDRPPDNFAEIRGRKSLSPNDFIKLAYEDLEGQVEGRSKWLNEIDDFESLLDDILNEYKDLDINGMDCY